MSQSNWIKEEHCRSVLAQLIERKETPTASHLYHFRLPADDVSMMIEVLVTLADSLKSAADVFCGRTPEVKVEKSLTIRDFLNHHCPTVPKDATIHLGWGTSSVGTYFAPTYMTKDGDIYAWAKEIGWNFSGASYVIGGDCSELPQFILSIGIWGPLPTEVKS